MSFLHRARRPCGLGSHFLRPREAVLGPGGWLSGVYAAEDSCGCHTVGAGDAATITAASTEREKVTFRIGDRTFTITLYTDISCVRDGGGGSGHTAEDLARAAAQMGVPVCAP